MKSYNLTQDLHGLSVSTSETDNEVIIAGRNFGLCASLKHPFELCDKSSYTLNKWNHIFFNKNSGEINLYINGEKKKKDTSPTLSNLTLDVN